MKNKGKLLVMSAIALFGVTAAATPVFNKVELRQVAATDKTYSFSSNTNFDGWSADKTAAGYESDRGTQWSKTGFNLTLAAPFNVSKVVIDASINGSGGTIKVGNSATQNLSGKHQLYSFDVSIAKGETITITTTASSKSTYIKSIVLTEAEETKVLSSLAISNQQTSYYQGDSLVMPTITATYEGGTTADVSSKAIFVSQDTSTVGQHTVQVSYTEDNITKTVDYTYTVIADELQSLTLGGVVTGKKGQAWDLSGVILTGSFTSSNKIITSFTPSTTTAIPTTNGTYDVVVDVSYGGKSTSKTFTVNVVSTGETEDDPITVAQAMSIAQGVSNSNITKVYYVLGIITADPYNLTYGNFYINDNGNDNNTKMTVYGVTADQSKLSYSDGKWNFSNPKDFGENTATKNLKAGDKVLLKLRLYDFKGTLEGDGLFIKLVSNEHTVTSNLTNASFDKVGTQNFDSTFSGTITASTGYNLPTALTVTLGGNTFTSFTYNNTTGAFSIAAGTVAEDAGDLVITGTATKKTFSITNNLTSVTSSNTATSIEYGSSFETTLSVAEHYKPATVTVTMGGVTQTAAYNAETGKVSIASVTGALVITASSEEYTVTSVELSTDDCKVAAGGSLEVTATVLPEELADTSVVWSVASEDVSNEAYLFSQVGNKIKLDVLDNATSGTITLTATPNGNGGATKAKSINVTVTNYQLTGVKVSGSPTVTTQYTGHDFDYSGLTFTEIYNDDETVVNPNANALEGDDIVWNDLVAGQDPTGTYTVEGFAPITVTVQGVTVVQNNLESISIEGDLTNKNYYSNAEEFNLAGLTVSGLMTSGESASITQENVEWSTSANPADLIGQNQTMTVTATYGGKTATKDITGINVTERKVIKLEVTNKPKTSYILGESFSSDGLVVKATYNDGTSDTNFTGYTLNKSAINNLAEGTYTVSVELEGALSASFNVTYSKLVEQEAIDQWTKVTSEPTSWAGEYLIGIVNDTTAKIFNGLDDASDTVDSNISNNTITSKPEKAVSVLVEEMNGGYSLKIVGGEKDGKYIQGTSGSNTINYQDKPGLNTLEFTDSGVKIISNTSYFLFNSNTNNERFRYYKPGNFGGDGYICPTLFLHETQEGITASPIAMVDAKIATGLDLKIGDKVTASQFSAFILKNNGDKVDATNLTINGGSEVTLNATSNVITVSNGTFSQEVVVTAREVAKVTGITVTGSDAPMFAGETQTLTATVAPDGADNKVVEWSSSDTSIATVDKDTGVVTAQEVDADGKTATITATATDGSGITGSFVVHVDKDDLSSIQLASAGGREYYYGDEFDPSDIVITAEYDSGKTENVACSDHPEDFSFSCGETLTHSDNTITITYGGKTCVLAVTVKKVVDHITVEDYEDEVYQNCEYNIYYPTITAYYSDGTSSEIDVGDVTVSLDTSEIGSTEGTVTYGGKTATITVNVKKDEVKELRFVSGSGQTEYDYGTSFNAEDVTLEVLYCGATPKKQVHVGDEGVTMTPETFTEHGNQVVTFSYTENNKTVSCSLTIKVNKVVTELEIVGTPTIQKDGVAYDGDIYQFDNITALASIKHTYSNGDVETVDKTIAIDTSNPGTGSGTYTINGVSVNYEVSGIKSLLDSIELTTSGKTSYVEGEEFDPTGFVVTAHYGETSIDVTDKVQFVGTDSLVLGDNDVTIKYTEGGITKEISLTVNVVAKEISTLEVTQDACKVYVPGESFDPQGLTLKATYNDGTVVEGITSTSDKPFTYTVDGNVVHVSWSDGTLSKTIDYTIENKTLTDISEIVVSVEDSKLSATVGDNYEFEGTVTAKFEGTTKTIELEEGQYIVTGIDTSTAGEKIITVTANGKTDTYTLNVALPAVETVTISGGSTEAYLPEETVTLTATVNPSNANQGVTWTTSNSNVATVVNGVVTFHGEGTAIITASSVQDPTKKATITLTCETVHVTGVEVLVAPNSMVEGETQQTIWKVSPNDAGNTNVSFISSDESVAKVNSDGVVTAVGAGSATITIKTVDGNKTATFNVTVTARVINVESVSLSETTKTIEAGNTFTLTATVNPDNATDKTVTWESSDTSVATVNSNGVVTGLKAGTVTITVKTSDGNKIASCVVTITGGGTQGGNENGGGCFGSIVATSALVSLATLAGAGLAISKKRKKEDK